MTETNGSNTEHRTFLLTLDADDGEMFAHEAGFTSASEDVRDRENIQVLKDWAAMDAEGIIPHLVRYAKWFTEVAYSEELEGEDKEMAVNSAVTFAGAAIARLKNKGFLETPAHRRVIAIAHDEDGNEVGGDNIPIELLDHAAEMYAWKYGDEDELDEEMT